MDDWKLIYTGWNPQEQPLREALCTLGNGYIATRGAAEEATAGGAHYPGTYLAGGYNRLSSEVTGRMIENEDLVNWPNWLCLTCRPEDGAWLNLDEVEVLDYRQELDLQGGVFTRDMRFRDRKGKETDLRSRRLVHMGEPHLVALEWELTPLNWSGQLIIQTALDGAVTNSGVERYRELNGKHLVVENKGKAGEDLIFLTVHTSQSRMRMAQAARTRVFDGDRPSAVVRTTREDDESVSQELKLQCNRNRPVRIEKIAAIYDSRDRAISEPAHEACKAVHRAPGFEVLMATHQRAWEHLWRHFDVGFEGGNQAQLILRLHTFHTLQTGSPNTIPMDVGIPSRGLHGEAYRGHVFWDELFVFPFFNLRIPELARTLLMYRYSRLNEARHAAREAGLEGAMFPWQSGSNGREESQVIHLNPKSGKWIPDNTHRQRHVNAAIAYNTWQYYQATTDAHFLAYYGAELILEIARFWASLATFDADRDRYEICGVVGPDEFHTRYPDSQEPGVKNNAYTNVMAAWSLRCATRALEELTESRRTEIIELLELDPEEPLRWEKISRKLLIPFHDGTIISQFEGYEQLEEFDWERYREKYGDIQRLDRILEAEGDTVNRYKAGKQADVLMLFYLFSTEELRDLFEWMGYTFDPKMIPANIRYYQQRTSHGSTLSRIVYAWVLARVDRPGSWQLFNEALTSDFGDIQGGTTAEGIHLGAMAGSLDMIQRCYTGLEIRGETLRLNPRLPNEVRKLNLQIRYHDHWLHLELTQKTVRISIEPGWRGKVPINVQDETHDLKAGEEREIALKHTT